MDLSRTADPNAPGGAPSPADGVPDGGSPAARRTLPPPEWLGPDGSRSASGTARFRLSQGEPVARRNGPRAELESRFARLAAARKSGDEATERATAAELARALMHRGSELEQATRLARRALLLGEDPVLREELAGWFGMLGEPALAAATLRPLLAQRPPTEAGPLLTRIGTLLARAGEATAAREAFEEAMAAAPADPNPAELAAALGAWAPEVVSPVAAAGLYLIASERRERLGERAAAFENVLRAFEMAPESSDAAERLARLLRDRGRTSAADEVRREHARHAGPAARAVHLARLHEAAQAGDWPRALGAALDARLDAEIDVKSALVALTPRSASERDEASIGFDELLERLGLAELQAARLDVAGDLLGGLDRARARVALARLYEGALGRPDPAIEAWIDALVADPGNPDARAALRRHAERTGDPAPLVEALVRVAETSGTPPERSSALHELVALGDESLVDPALARWAAGRLEELGEAAAVTAALARLEPRARATDQALEAARAELQASEGLERVERLSRIAALLSARPDQADAMLPVLLELVELVPDERAFQLGVDRLLVRQGRLEELGAFYARQLARASSAGERARLRLALANVRRRSGDLDGALEVLEPLVSEPIVSPAALCMTALLAAQQGQEALRARALLRLSVVLASPLRAVIAAVCGELLLRAGDVDAAKRAVEQALAADPSLARAAAARAAVGAVTGDRWGAEAMERAMGVVVPRAPLSAALAATYDKLGEPLLALAFGQRQIALRPGDLGAVRDRLVRTLALEDGARLADALSWVFAQPQPLDAVSELVARALRALAPLEPERGAALARRALDVLGPRNVDVRLAVLSVADITGERGLGIAALERWLASGADSADRSGILLDLARRRRASGDHDGSARSLLRAIRDGAWATAVLAELEAAPPAKSSDGEIALLAARAEALSGLSEADPHATALAWRELGAAYWDLAGDTESALRAWERASVLDVDSGVENFASDLVAFGGVELAIARLEEFAERRSDDQGSARVLALVGAIALEANQPVVALRAALRALDRDPTRADVLSIVERAAGDSDVEVLERTYQRLAESVLGRYGARSVHYRAARQLERRQARDLALAHAIHAFEAVPSEGAVFMTLARLAEQAGDPSEVVRVLSRVASNTPDPELRAMWLRRAAALSGQGEDGLRLRLDVLFRALLVRADSGVLSAIGDAVRGLLALCPDEADVLELRLSRALAAPLRRAEGPDGARLCLLAARLWLDAFPALPPSHALEALARAVDCDGDIEEYRSLDPFAARLAPEAGPLVERVVGLASDRMANVGPALLELASEIAAARGDARSAALLLVHAARRDPEDRALVERAERAARELGDPELIGLVLDAIPPDARAGALLELAEHAERAGDLHHAIDLLEGAREVPGLAPADATRVLEALIDAYRRLGQRERVEELLEEAIHEAGDDVARRSRLAAELAALVGARGDGERALTILELALRDAPEDAGLLGDYVALARQEGDRQRLAQGLLALVERVADLEERAAILRELAELLELSGDLAAAHARWVELLQIAPEDPLALAALEREAERRNDYETLAALLARRAALASSVDEVRRIRLRRAAVLEHRLGRPDEARAELEALTAATGDHWSVLRVLADLNERLGAPVRAAPLWLRASAVTTDREEASDLACRACEAYLSGGDVDSARRVLDGMLTWRRTERVLALAVEIERRRESPLALAEALEELAEVSSGLPEQRASLLVEAAQASLAGGAMDEALARAERATELCPTLASAQLLFRSLAYRRRGPPTGAEAARAVDELAVLTDLAPADGELLAFLLAESLDSIAASEAALRELEDAEQALGARPLIALALAERLARAEKFAEALPYFDLALGGDLRGLRPRARVALLAAEAARSHGERERAAGYLEIAAEDPEYREQAAALGLELQAKRSAAPGEPRFRPSLDPGVLVSFDRPPALSGRYSARPETDEERPLAARIADSASRLQVAGGIADAEPEATPGASSSIAPAPVGVGRYSLRAHAERPSSRPPVVDRLGSDDSSSKILKLNDGESELYAALSRGSAEAGRALIRELEGRPDRSRDLVTVCRRLAAVLPGDVSVLAQLRDAAQADKDASYARAIEHAIHALDAGAPRVPPPPLAEQVEQPDAVRRLLLREQACPALDALALVWEGAEHVFRRDPSTYGVTGLERVPLSAPTALARAYSAAARALGMLRTPLFQRRSTGPITVGLALLSPPAVVLSGDVRQESPELAYQLGATLFGALPQFALLLGSGEAQARAVLSGLAFAFGPPEGGAAAGRVPNLAEVLWESIPARLQRRLRELCSAPGALDYDAAVRAARLAGRRAGLFISGDLRVALRECCLEEGIPLSMLETPEKIAELAAVSAPVKSLILLATSPEYAQTRWQSGRAAR